MANTPVPSRAVEYSTRGTSKPREYMLTPEELEEIRQKYPATKRDVNFKKPVAHNPRTDQRHLNHEEDKDMGGQRTSKEGPSCGLTKKLFLEQIATGETVSSIEKAWGMKYNTLYNWVKNWDCRGVTPDKAREILAQLGETSGYTTEPDKTQLLREKETLPQQSVSHDMIKEYKSQLDQVKCALDESVLENERLTTELAEVKQMFDDAYQRNMNGNAKIGQHLQAIQELKAEVEHWQGEAERSVAITDKADEQLRAELQVLQDEMNRMISERDELVAERDELYHEKTAWTENEKMLNQLVEDLRDDIRRLREIQKQAAEPFSETQLLDRSIAELTRARKIINLLSASGE
jgi:hypothetical protein